MAFKRIASIGQALLRRKKIDDSQGESKLDRCLGTLDLTALGIGSTLGLGIYVLAGQVASTKAGPAVVISFLVAAIASVFAGLCYAEFGARVPRAGSAYIYSYVTVGEFMAFVIGWNLVLEYVIGTASVARGYSGYLDALANNSIHSHFKTWMPISFSGLSEYPDFLAFLITFLLTIMLAVGVKESTRFNSVFTCLNLLVVLFVIVSGSFNINFENWKLENVPEGAGTGGFMPFGFSGMMAGAATCFYGFIGFDVIATTGEEVRNPNRAIPISIVMSLLFIFLAYFGVSGIQTLMWPYWDQANDAPLPYVFDKVGWPVARYIVSIGALAGLSTSLLGAMFPLPRVLYAMATDGVIFRQLAEVHPRFKTPLLATFLSGIFAGILAAIFNVAELADMMSIGTLLAYSLVAISVLILKFRDEEIRASTYAAIPSDQPDRPIEDRSFWKMVINAHGETRPTPESATTSTYLIILICGEIILCNSFLIGLQDELFEGSAFAYVIVLLSCALLIATVLALARQPRSQVKLSFSVPCVPLVPVLSVFINVYLMLKLTTPTWIRFGVWMIFGLLIYGFYGFRNSTGSMSEEEKRQYLMRRSISSEEAECKANDQL